MSRICRGATVLGRALAASGERSGAIAALETARGSFLRFGATRLAELAARELRQVGQHIPRPGRRSHGDHGLESLSDRELEVAQLVTDRLTNRQNAERLVLSEKTIERHLSHIFQKLDVSSRVAVARTIEKSSPSRQLESASGESRKADFGVRKTPA